MNFVTSILSTKTDRLLGDSLSFSEYEAQTTTHSGISSDIVAHKSDIIPDMEQSVGFLSDSFTAAAASALSAAQALGLLNEPATT